MRYSHYSFLLFYSYTTMMKEHYNFKQNIADLKVQSHENVSEVGKYMLQMINNPVDEHYLVRFNTNG